MHTGQTDVMILNYSMVYRPRYAHEVDSVKLINKSVNGALFNFSPLTLSLDIIKNAN